jgi:acetyl-CoA carboxylase/biotin carboxylase 1
LFALQECPDVALDAVVEIVQHLAPHQRTEALRTLAQLESISKEQEQQHQQQQQQNMPSE